MAGKKTGKRLLTLVLVLVMALSLLPVSALAADGTIVYGGVTLYTEKRPQRYTFLRSNGENAVTKNVGDTGFYQRLPRDTYVHTSCGTVLAEFIPDYYSASTTTVELSDPTVLKDLSWTISGWNGNDKYKGFPCLTFNFTAAKPGTTTVKLTFYYNYDHGGEIGYCNGCGGRVQYKANRYWWQETTTFTVTVTGEEEKPEYTLTYHENTTDPVTNMPDPKTVTLKSSTSPVTFTVSGNKPGREGYTFLGWAGNPNATEPTVKPSNTITTPATASDLVWEVQHTQTAPTITFNLTYDKNSETWVKPAASPRIEATHEVTPPKAPTADELKKLEMAKMAVLVKCDVDDTQQHTEAYGLLGEYNEDYIVGAPKKDGDDWLCEISYDPDLYVAEFNTAFPNLKHVRNDEKIVPVTLIWADGSWQLKTQGSVHVTEEYTVTFNAYGGFPTPDEQHVKSGEKAVLPAEPTLKGHTFAFWYLGDDEENATAYDFDTPVTGDITLTAKWNINKYTVTFNSYGGTPVPPAQEVEYGLTATKPDDPTLKGHTFAFWYLGEDEENATAYDFNTPVTENITLTAKWNINKYTVTFNSYGGTPVPPAQEVEYGLTATKPADPTLKGYTFAFWYLGEDEQNATAYDFNTPVTENITLTAKWNINKYTVTFNSYGGTPVPPAQEVEYGLTATKPDDPTLKGYTFAFWYLGEDEENATAYDFDTPVTGDITLTAKWNINKYTVTFNSYGGTPVPPAQEVEYGLTATEPATAPTKTGYTFDGWYLGDEKYDFSDAVEQNITLYANWKKNIYTVTYTDGVDGEEVFADQTYRVPFEDTTPAFKGNPTRDGYVFDGWKPAFSDTVTGNVTYVAQWTARTDLSYTVHYYLKNTTKQVANDKMVAGQTFNADVTENAIRISGYRVYGDSVKSITIGTGTNEIIFYYTRASRPSTPSKPTLNTGDHYAYVMGYPDGMVRPNGSITRAEVSTILFRLLSDKTRDEYFTTESSFTDVKAGAWYNNSIATLEKAGVIVDTAKGGAFRPNEAITRAELAAMLAQFSDAKPVKGVKFSDVSAEHWAYEAIAIAAKMGWIEGYPDGTFRPDATITRAEMMTLVNRALERVPSDEDHLLSKRVMLTFPDCKSGDWFYIAVQEATNSHTYERAATEKNGDEQWTALRANRDWTLLEK